MSESIAPDELEQLQRQYMESHGKIEGHGHRKFSHLHGDDREEAVQEMRALAWAAYRRLHERGFEITDQLRAGTAVFSGKSAASGGRLVGQQKVNDVMSPARRHGHNVGAPREEEVVEDSSVDESILGVDFETWLDTLDDTLRTVALLLKEGLTNEQIGVKFGFSRGWTSLRRAELRESWTAFFGEDPLE